MNTKEYAEHLANRREEFGDRPIIRSAREAGRTYITPEDLDELVEDGVDIQELRRDFLMICAYGFGWNVEDKNTCFHVLVKNEEA